jgi:hypothetical protein
VKTFAALGVDFDPASLKLGSHTGGGHANLRLSINVGQAQSLQQISAASIINDKHITVIGVGDKYVQTKNRLD